jgi:hypothetical protein
MIFAFALLKHRLGVGQGSRRAPEDNSENLRLRSEVKELKERIQVLERITTDRENSLSRQIDELRDR